MSNTPKTPKYELTIPLPITAGDLYNWLERLPVDAVVTTTHTPGDRPFESATSTLEINWDLP